MNELSNSESNHRTRNMLLGFVLILAVGSVIVGIVFLSMGDAPTGMDQVDQEYEVLAEGDLQRLDGSHWGEGPVQLIEYSNGTHALYFDGVEINDGPDLYVYLSKKSTFTGPQDSPGEYVNLGPLPYLKGTFEVKIEDSVQVENFNSVLIWCDPFSVVFSYATLA